MGGDDGDGEDHRGVFAADRDAQGQSGIDIVSKPRLLGNSDGEEANDKGEKGHLVIGTDEITKLYENRADGDQKDGEHGRKPLATKTARNQGNEDQDADGEGRTKQPADEVKRRRVIPIPLEKRVESLDRPGNLADEKERLIRECQQVDGELSWMSIPTWI